jgi:integrase
MFGDNIQRWLCRNCGLRFSDPTDVQRAWSTFERVERVDTKPKRGTDDIVTTRQICVMETKNLAAEQKEIEVPRRSEDINGKIVDFMWQLKKEAYAEDTIMGYGYVLKTLVKRGANLFKPESVKEVIARQATWGQARKYNVVKAYACFLNKQGIKTSLPTYVVPEKLPFIPAEEEIDQLIAGCGTQMAAFLQLLKETGARCGEAYRLKWMNIDTKSGTISVTPEKGSNPRLFKVSGNLVSMLNNLPKTSTNLFTYKNKFYLRKTFMKQRQRIAARLANPRMLQIHFHTFRHWKATMEYHRTKDILYVMRLLGHKSITNTLKYTQLVSFQGDDYVCKAATSLQEASQLIEAGFDYVTQMENVKLFRKRK